jgi:hypothetical protein
MLLWPTPTTLGQLQGSNLALGSNNSFKPTAGVGQLIKQPSRAGGGLILVLDRMKVSELQSAFLNNVKLLLPDWRFVASSRHFTRSEGTAILFFHISCINHPSDFDAVGNVAVEFVSQKKRVAIVGASLGNISGTGQSRHSVASLRDSVQSAASLVEEFNRIGIPFLERYSNPANVLTTMQSGGSEALLISPIASTHASQIDALIAFTQAI